MVPHPNILQFKKDTLRIPVFFPSVSTVKTTLSPYEYVTVLHALRSSQFLVSAFDLHHANEEAQNALRRLLKEAIDAGVTVLMDSGKYESYWKEMNDSWSQNDFHGVLSRFECTFAFGFDEQAPPDDFDSHVKLVYDRYKIDQSIIPEKPVVPIVHGSPNALPRLCAKISDLTGVEMIAVPDARKFRLLENIYQS